MAFLTKRRRDGVFVSQKGSYSVLLNYVSRTRTESLIYFNRQIRVDALMDLLARKKAAGTPLTFFNVVATALARTVSERPQLNRFIAGQRLYQRKVFDISYIVKREKTDDAPDTIARICLEGDETLHTVAERMNGLNRKLRADSNDDADFFINALGWLPRFVLRFIVWILRRLDYNGAMPKSLAEAQPYYASVFVSNLGSIGVDAPFHHLYEHGTTSIFLTIGKVHDAPVVDEAGNIVKAQVANFAFTVDERISDGFYMARAIERFEYYLQNPSLLEEPSAPQADAAVLAGRV